MNCVHITCLARHCNANYPMLRCSGDNNHHKTFRADEVACERWFSDPDPPPHLSFFALFVSFFFYMLFFLPCEIAHLDWGQMAQRAPKRALTPTSHLAAMPRHARAQTAKHQFCQSPLCLLSPLHSLSHLFSFP